jgi:hypothetical protein
MASIDDGLAEAIMHGVDYQKKAGSLDDNILNHDRQANHTTDLPTTALKFFGVDVMWTRVAFWVLSS